MSIGVVYSETSGNIATVQYTIGSSVVGHCTRGVVEDGRFRARGWSEGLFSNTKSETEVKVVEGDYDEVIICYSQNHDTVIAIKAQIS